MKLSEKIVALRRSRGLSQEALAQALGVSRQAVSRWEMGSAMPDAANILQLSKLFAVTADYLLNDSDGDALAAAPPQTEKKPARSLHQIMIYLVTLEVMALLLVFMSVFILQSAFFGVLSFLPFVACVGGFAYAQHKHRGQNGEQAAVFCRRFYKLSAWLGAYFPVRLAVTSLAPLYPRPYPALALECVILALYLMTASLLCLAVDRHSLSKT